MSKLVLMMKWLLVALYSLLLVVGQSTSILLGRYYFDQGGKSKWLNSTLASAAFPLLLPLFFFFPSPSSSSSLISTHELMSSNSSSSSLIRSKLAFYLFFGIALAGCSLMYTYGSAYLPASTFSLITAAQLPFNALFSFFFNSQRFTPPIWNSLVILILSSILLATNSSPDRPIGVTTSQFYIGFGCTLFATALAALGLSITEYFVRNVLKLIKQEFSIVLEMQIGTSVVTTVVSVIGLLVSQEWRVLGEDMDGFAAGRFMYVMVNVGIAVGCQMCYVGVIGLVISVSSLFCNVISTVALPIVPVLAVVFFHDRMDGVKVIALLMSVWGSISYMYHQDMEEKKSSCPRDDTNDHEAGSEKTTPIMSKEHV